MWFYSEDFIFLLAGSCMGLVMALAGGIGCFLLAFFGKDESVGEVRVGKVFNVKGVSLIMLSICGVGLMGACVYTWGQTRQASDAELDLADYEDYDWGYDMMEDGEWEEGPWPEEEFVWDDDDSADGFSP